MDANELARRTKLLRQHCESVSAKECVWGEDDCSKWVGAWVELVRRTDIGMPRYFGEAEARELIAAAGGIDVIWSRIAVMAGLHETGHPEYGDICLFQTKIGPVGVIMAHNGICAWRAENGVSFIRPRKIMKAWAV